MSSVIVGAAIGLVLLLPAAVVMAVDKWRDWRER